ncbi:tol-pal system protein YbgF [Alphaproteobacteria bacterium]|nr:tol-pal system protein YbgF [Alphaproteobacteria bacterium]
MVSNSFYKLYSVKAGFFSGLCALVLCSFISGDAFAQSTRDLSNRLNRLENEMDTLNRSVYKGEAPPPSSFNSGSGQSAQQNAAQEVRVQQLEAELRGLTGQIEQQNFKIRQMEQLLEKVTGDLGVRIEDLERRGGGASSSEASQYTAPNSGTLGNDGYQWNSGASSVEVNPDIVGEQNIGSPNQPAALYENAFSLLKNNKYDTAEKQFKVFVDRYPDHVLAGNAKYWLGETYYVRGQYDSAVRIFAEAYQQYPKSAKAPDNLLKLGMSLAGSGKKEDACVAFSQLKKEFSSSEGPVLRRGEQEMQRLGC